MIYRFISRWRVRGTTGEVADVLRDPLDLVRWWPAVYLAADEIAPPDERGLGQRVRLRTRGFLPYTLNWELEVTESRYPVRFAIAAHGDFVGRGVWTLEQDGDDAIATYDWQVTAEKPLLRTLGPALRPLFEANHRWAMRQGEESLRLELLRRRAASAEAKRSVPPPPGPVTYAAVGILAGAAVVGGGLAYLILRQRKARRRSRH
ncbi:MAG: hypothetical protein QM731_29095 [Chitinophagaceae bacterium]